MSDTIKGQAVSLEWMAPKDDNADEYYCYRKEDISDRTEILLDKLGVIEILKKKARNLLEMPALKALLLKLENYDADVDFEMTIG